jgi:mRNA-degrading endonuclease RelE of RelBE toxin-antitoxin system
MSFHVDWTARAENELADVWMNSPDPDAVRTAVDEIERRLRRDPLALGESRELGHRIVFEPPVSLIYWIDAVQRIVTVVSIHGSGPRR